MYSAVKSAGNEETAREIVFGKDDSARAEDNPTWVKSVMQRLENHFDRSEVVQIRMHCQCGYGMEEKLTLLRELFKSSSSIEEFGNLEKAKAAGLFTKNGELYLQFLFCPCPMLSEVKKLETDTWCQCSAGYSKVLFEKAFGCKVDVELLKSIKMGDEVCLMKIIPRGNVWHS